MCVCGCVRWEAGLNEYADLTWEEFQGRVLMAEQVGGSGVQCIRSYVGHTHRTISRPVLSVLCHIGDSSANEC